MKVKLMALFYVMFVITACAPIAPKGQGETESARTREVFLKDNIELKHGQSYDEWRKGLPAYWN
ncbi:hypothetical protein STUTZSP0542_11510 [Stutzerimonas marianensis]